MDRSELHLAQVIKSMEFTRSQCHLMIDEIENERGISGNLWRNSDTNLVLYLLDCAAHEIDRRIDVANHLLEKLPNFDPDREDVVVDFKKGKK